MSERSTVTAGTWQNIGTGPATVQLISTGTTVMLVCSATEPTGNDGLILVNQGDSHTFQLTDAIYAQAVSASAIVAVQPE